MRNLQLIDVVERIVSGIDKIIARIVVNEKSIQETKSEQQNIVNRLKALENAIYGEKK